MRFKDFIQERAMNTKAFADIKLRLGDTVSVGFEFEMIVPDDSQLYSTDDSVLDNRGTERIQGYDTIDEFEEYFEISRYDLQSINKAFNEWQEERKRDWVDSKWTRYSEDDDGNDEDEAREKALADYDERDFGESEWITSEFRFRKQFTDEFGLEPKFGWYEESDQYAAVYTEELNNDEDSIKSSAVDVANDLKTNLFLDVIVFNDRHEMKKYNNKWYIEPDSSIIGNSKNDHGMELVSPPQKLQQSLKYCNSVFKWMQKNKIYTNKTTGLHINISIPDIKNKLDPLKLVLFMGEKYAAQLYKRADNSNNRSQVDNVVANILKNGELPDSLTSLKNSAFNLLSNAKYFSVNLSKLTDGYLEFRVAGGTDYHMDFKKVEDTVLRFVSALELACDPDLEKNEYAKKLSKLMTGVAGVAKARTPIDINERIPVELQRFNSLNTEVARAFGKFTSAKSEDEKFNFLQLINLVLAVCKSFKTELTIKERVYFKRLASKIGLTSANIDSMETDEMSRARIKKGIGL